MSLVTNYDDHEVKGAAQLNLDTVRHIIEQREYPHPALVVTITLIVVLIILLIAYIYFYQQNSLFTGIWITPNSQIIKIKELMGNAIITYEDGKSSHAKVENNTIILDTDLFGIYSNNKINWNNGTNWVKVE